MHKREIFMLSGAYIFCEILETRTVDGNAYMLRCRTPDNRDFFAKKGYGTWCEVSSSDSFVGRHHLKTWRQMADAAYIEPGRHHKDAAKHGVSSS
jgi:hypothetical protein